MVRAPIRLAAACDVFQKANRHLPIMSTLLGIDEPQINMWLCNRKIVTATEVLVKPLSVPEVGDDCGSELGIDLLDPLDSTKSGKR